MTVATETWEDAQVEYDKLLAGLALPAVTAAAGHWHAGRRHFDNSLKIKHLQVVAELASRYAACLFASADDWERRYYVAACRVAGLLHETMVVGAAFEDLVTVADELVARAVAELTPDIRQPWPKRAQVYANQIGRASPLAQVVKLADLRHDLTLLEPLLAGAPGGTVLTELRCRLGEMRGTSLALNRLRPCLALRGKLQEVQTRVRALELQSNKLKG